MPTPTTGEPGGFPSPLPVLTVLLVSALLAALGIIMVARDKAPALGWVFLVVGILGAVFGVGLAVRNVRAARVIERQNKRAAQDDAE